jgi:regulatory protein
MSDAFEDGLRLLSRRALTRHEVEERLRARRHSEGDVAAAVEKLVAMSAIDDAALARQWIESQARAKGRGRARALATLSARGVDEELAAAAWSSAVSDEAIDEGEVLARAVRKRLGLPPGSADRGRLARVYNALLSEGFGEEQVEAALAPFGFERNDR